jgi:sulfatase modifying factor 1
MGAQQFYPDEGTVHDRHIEPFAIEQHPVSNAQFSEFVSDTGYVTVAERPLDQALFAELTPEELEAGSLVFTPTPGPVDLSNWRQLVALVGRCRLATSVRPRVEHRGEGRSPCGSGCLC